MQYKKFRLVRATVNTLNGIKALWKNEQAFRQEIYVSILLLPLLFLMTIPATIKLILILLLLFLLVIEALNSGLEGAIDRISLERHEQSKLVKDIGSAAVGLAIVMNLIAWIYAIYLHFY